MGEDLEHAIDLYENTVPYIVWSQQDAAELAGYLSTDVWENRAPNPFPDDMYFHGGTYRWLSDDEQEQLENHFTAEHIDELLDEDLPEGTRLAPGYGDPDSPALTDPDGRDEILQELPEPLKNHYSAVSLCLFGSGNDEAERRERGIRRRRELTLYLNTFFEEYVANELDAYLDDSAATLREMLGLDDDTREDGTHKHRLDYANDEGLIDDRMHSVMDMVRDERNDYLHDNGAFDSEQYWKTREEDKQYHSTRAVRLYESLIGMPLAASLLNWDRFGRLKELTADDLRLLGVQSDLADEMGPIEEPVLFSVDEDDMIGVARPGDNTDNLVVPRDSGDAYRVEPDDVTDDGPAYPSGQDSFDAEHAATVEHTLLNRNREGAVLLMASFFKDYLEETFPEQVRENPHTPVNQFEETPFDGQVNWAALFADHDIYDLGLDTNAVSDTAAYETLKQVKKARDKYGHSLVGFDPDAGPHLSDGHLENALRIYEDLNGHTFSDKVWKIFDIDDDYQTHHDKRTAVVRRNLE